jgi:hypothetical protein
MPYTVDVFRSWSKDFTTWEALRTWLQSAEGGSLRVVEPRDTSYALVRYIKGQSNFDAPHVRWCRSVVVNKDTRLPVCVAPPKGSAVTSDTMTAVMAAEEFVDGTMLNLFHEHGADKAQFATRSRIGGDGKFYDGGLTFKQMFDAALAENGMKYYSAVLPEDDNTRISQFTSTVIQHPSNRIVRQITKPSFVIVHQGCTASDGTVYIEEDPESFHCDAEADADFFEVQPYTLASVRGAKSVESWVAQQAQERGFGWQGVVLKDGKGNRWRARSQVYETVRRIRGNESSTEERFARLRKSRGTEQYLAFYPEDRETFYELEGRLRKNTRQLSHFYGDVFRAKKTAYYELPWPYKHHVSVLHNLYKDTLKKEGKKVTLEEVIKYVNGLSLEDIVNMSITHKLELRKKTDAAVETEEKTVTTA